MRVFAITGSLRAVSSNTALLEAAAALAPPGMEIAVFRRLGDLPLFNPDLDGEGHAPPSEVAALRAQVASAGGVIISSPEYAHGVPGAMKNALDWLVSYPEFAGKPVKSSLAALAAFESPRPPREASPRRLLRPEGDRDRWNGTSPPAFPGAETANPRGGGAR